jgi:hypothetical protein
MKASNMPQASFQPRVRRACGLYGQHEYTCTLRLSRNFLKVRPKEYFIATCLCWTWVSCWGWCTVNCLYKEHKIKTMNKSRLSVRMHPFRSYQLEPPLNFLRENSNLVSIGPIQATSNKQKQTNKLRGFIPQANYTDRATAACRRS